MEEEIEDSTLKGKTRKKYKLSSALSLILSLFHFPEGLLFYVRRLPIIYRRYAYNEELIKM